MRSLSFVVIACCFTSGACTADHVAGPSTLPSSSASSVAAGEGNEASAAAHLDLREVRAELLAADRAYAEAAKSVNLIDALVAPLALDAVFLAPGPVILRGPDAARAVLSANQTNALSKWSWTAIRADVSGDGKEGYTMGYTELTQPSGTVLPGRYVAYWAKQADGTWKVEAYKRIPRAEGAVSLTPPPGFETPETKHRRYFPNTDANAEADAVAATDRAFSDLAQVVGNAESFARYAAPTGAQSGNSESVGWVFGPAAIREAHAGEPLGIISWAPEIARAASSGDLAFTVGWVFNDAGERLGKYFSVWQKQNTGAWRYIVD
jgi:ketosteroid isomerase-like protein